MFGLRDTRAAARELPDDKQLARKLRLASWLALAFGALLFPLLDLVMLRLIDDGVTRVAVRWAALGVMAIWVSTVLTRRTLRVVGHSISAERAARHEAEALAELTASIAAGQGIQETLQTAVDAAAHLFGVDVHCSVALPCEDGLLRIKAFTHESTRKVAQFAFKPGEGFNGIAVAVNLSMCNLQDEQLPEKLGVLLVAIDVPASLLLVEITESTLMTDAERTLAILARVREMGIRVAIDDFGTGHSSLAYLKRLAVDEVKIDRSFVRDMTVDETDRLIVRSTVDLSHGLGLRVVAEGVEDQITARLLAELGCDQAQGFHVSPPLQGDEVVPWATQGSQPTSQRAA